MNDYIDRKLETNLVEKLRSMPAVAILGPRQVGKSTLAKRVLSRIENSIYLDLERVKGLAALRIESEKTIPKSPKIYFRDSGLLHTFLGITDHSELLSHPVYESSWEGFVIENICSECPDWRSSFSPHAPA